MNFPFFTMFINHLKVKKDTISEAINPKPYGNIISSIFGIVIKSFIPNSVVPTLIGI